MTVNAKCLVESAAIPFAETIQYVAPAAVRSIIDKYTVTNTTAGPLTITVKLIPSGGAAGAGNTIINVQALAAGQCYTCPEIVGHVLNPGDFISALPSAAGITCRASGREIT